MMERSYSSRRRGGSSGWMFKLKMFFATVAVVFLIVSFFWGESGLVRMYYLHKRIDRVRHDIAVLKVQRNDLLWETDKIKNDPDYIQKYAIETYGYAKPDQKIIQFVPADSSGTSSGVKQIAVGKGNRQKAAGNRGK